MFYISQKIVIFSEKIINIEFQYLEQWLTNIVMPFFSNVLVDSGRMCIIQCLNVFDTEAQCESRHPSPVVLHCNRQALLKYFM